MEVLVPATRTRADVVLAQGAIPLPKRGPRGVGKGKGGVKKPQWKNVLNALHPSVPGLPRAVGPYTVASTTTSFKVPAGGPKFFIFCPFVGDPVADGRPMLSRKQFLPVCGLGINDLTNPINGTGNAYLIGNVLPGMGSRSTGFSADFSVAPAAMTVQVMNAKAVNSAAGVFYMTRSKQQLDMGGGNRTGLELQQQVLSFFTPRILTGGKLALRGVATSAFPLDMSEYSDFMGMFPDVPGETADGDFNYPAAKWREYVQPWALSPIVFSNAGMDSTDDITFFITIQWRVRYDPLNPASATHKHQDTWSDAAWNNAGAAFSREAHGVYDIAAGAIDAVEAAGDAAVAF